MSGKRRMTFMPNWDGWKLRVWRQQRDLSASDVAHRIGISTKSLYRFENGYPPPVDVANEIVCMTDGEIRYRDFWHGFNEKFA